MLLRALLWRALPRRSAGGPPARARRLSASGRLFEPVEALERSGHALGICRRRCRRAEELPALSHLSRLGDEPAGAAGVHSGLERRGARAGEPPPVSAEISRRPAAAAGAAVSRHAGGRFLSLAAHADRRLRIRPPPAP